MLSSCPECSRMVVNGQRCVCGGLNVHRGAFPHWDLAQKDVPRRKRSKPADPGNKMPRPSPSGPTNAHSPEFVDLSGEQEQQEQQEQHQQGDEGIYRAAAPGTREHSLSGSESRQQFESAAALPRNLRAGGDPEATIPTFYELVSSSDEDGGEGFSHEEVGGKNGCPPRPGTFTCPSPCP
jgi:hypothetical protein